MGYAAAAVILILILILAWLLMRMKIHLTFEYLHDKDNDKMTFKLSALYGLIRIKKTWPVIKINSEDASIDVKQDTKSEMKGQQKKKKKITFEDVKQTIDRIEMILQQVVRMRQIGASFLAGVRVTKFEWVTVIGIKDAVTGIAAGGVWAVKGALRRCCTTICVLYINRCAKSFRLFKCLLPRRICSVYSFFVLDIL